jgi:outer membrane protein insertion porin family
MLVGEVRMRERFIAAALAIVVSCLAAVASWPSAHAATVIESTIEVAGNRHVDADVIRSYFHAGADGLLDAAARDNALKSLYATSLFADVQISGAADHLLVKVIENPIIDKTAFDGNKKVKDDDLKSIIQSKNGSPLSRAIVHDDVERIIDVYRQHGYFEVYVEPKTIAAKNDRVDLVFEIKEGEKLAVRQIAFAGNASYSASKLRGVIKTGETNFLSLLFNNDIYDADRIESDVDLIRHFYRNHGYADVRVRSLASYVAAKKGVVVTFTIEEGTQYRVGRVDVDSNVKSVSRDAVQPYLRTLPGGIYDAHAVDKTIEDATTGLTRAGAPFITVLVRSERVPERRLINLVYTVDQGKRVYVERINIHGNSKTRDDVIRREFDLVEGDPYNRVLIDRAEHRLKQLGYFKSVKIDTQPGSAPDRVIVNVSLEEDKTADFWISGGYSTSAGAMAQVAVGDRDFLGTGDIIKASVSIGQYASGFDFGLTDPYALGPRLSLGIDLFGNEALADTYQSFNSTVYGAKISTGMPLNDQIGVTWSYAIYNQGISLDPAMGTTTLPIQQAAAAGPMWISSIGSSVTYTTLDNAKNPTEGVRIQSTNEFAGLGGAAKFARTSEDARYYHPIVGDVVGMVRTQGGYVTPWGGQSLPLLDGFFGGPQLVRGFAPNGFGPRDITPGTTQDNIGGNVYWTTSAELQAPVPFVPAEAQLKMALFSDAGSLWTTPASGTLASLSPSQQIANSQGIRASAGASLIWASPFGAIRVDYAYPFAKEPSDVTQRLNFTAGGF